MALPMIMTSPNGPTLDKTHIQFNRAKHWSSVDHDSCFNHAELQRYSLAIYFEEAKYVFVNVQTT